MIKTAKQTVRAFRSVNPFTNKLITEIPFASDDKVTEVVNRSWKSFQSFRNTDLASRSQRLLNVASLIEKNPEKYAKVITEEMGKPIKASVAEVLKSANHCKYYAERGQEILKPHVIKTEAKQSLVEFDPLGPILHIAPFNFPFFLTFKGGIPAMLVGNTLIHRTADSTPNVGKIIEELMRDAGFNNDEFITLYSSPDQTDSILAHKHVRGVSFTGSTNAGKIIAGMAGKHAKKTVMELGGSDPFLILDDADIDVAVNTAITSRLQNCGQVCFSAKRFLVDEKVYDQFRDKLLQKVQEYKIGDPMNPDTQMGPMARSDLLDNIDRQINKGVTEGAKLLYGGKRVEDPNLKGGNFYMPTVCEINNEENTLVREETFGPVFALMKVKGEEEGVRIANDSEFGLGATIISKNTDRAHKLARKIESGIVFINDVVKSDSRLPSGGVKSSGFGRECAEFGAHEFANIKTVVIN